MKPRTVPLHTCSWPSLPQRSGKTSKQNKLHGENVLPYLSKCVPKLKELHTWINNCVAHIYTRRKSACWISILLVKSSLTKPRTVPLHTCTWPPLPQRSGKTSKQNKLNGENVLPYIPKCVPKLKKLHAWINNCVANIYTCRKATCWISILLVNYQFSANMLGKERTRWARVTIPLLREVS